jgi:hypothetical protein
MDRFQAASAGLKKTTTVSGSRMRLIVGALEAFGAHVGVDLGGDEMGMTEQLLHAPQIRAGIQ